MLWLEAMPGPKMQLCLGALGPQQELGGADGQNQGCALAPTPGFLLLLFLLQGTPNNTLGHCQGRESHCWLSQRPGFSSQPRDGEARGRE